MTNQKKTKEQSKEQSKEYTYILIPVKTIKSSKLNPTNEINKYINKYNSKNKSYYHPNANNNGYSTYLDNSDIYLYN